jgi:hypothetical protein
MKSKNNNHQLKYKDKKRYTVCLDPKIAEKVCEDAAKEARKPAALMSYRITQMYMDKEKSDAQTKA